MRDKGSYFGFTFGVPAWGGVGGGAYIDNSGRLYPQIYYGTPGVGASAGYTNDLGALLTGPSASATIGRGWVGANVATVGNETGVGFGTPGVGVTYGYGPLEFSQDYSQPWIKGLIQDSVDGAGRPSSRNVWEYDYPQPDDVKVSTTSAVPARRLTRAGTSNTGMASAPGSTSTSYPSTFDERYGGSSGLPWNRQSVQSTRPISAFAAEPNSSIVKPMPRLGGRSDAGVATNNSAGGLLGMIEDYMRQNAY